MDIQNALPVMQLLLAFANLCILGYAFFKFLGKPHEGLENRLSNVEFEIREIKESLKKGNDRFREQKEINEVLIRSVFALIEFEVHYCETEQKPISKNLEKAKDDLHDYFAKGKG